MQPVATGGKWNGPKNGSDKRKPLPWVATSCLSRSMVRRGSTVRVRQRALQSPRESRLFLSNQPARAPVCGRYGAVLWSVAESHRTAAMDRNGLSQVRMNSSGRHERALGRRRLTDEFSGSRRRPLLQDGPFSAWRAEVHEARHSFGTATGGSRARRRPRYRGPRRSRASAMPPPPRPR